MEQITINAKPGDSFKHSEFIRLMDIAERNGIDPAQIIADFLKSKGVDIEEEH